MVTIKLKKNHKLFPSRGRKKRELDTFKIKH